MITFRSSFSLRQRTDEPLAQKADPPPADNGRVI